MRIGAHVSVAGGLPNGPLNAATEKCEVFQVFSRSPRGGKAPELTPQVLKEFRANMKAQKFSTFYIHAPYYVNFASKNNRIKYGSMSVIREELERGSLAGADWVVTHLGSSKEYTAPREALDVAIQSFVKALNGYQGSCGLALETSAGAGQAIGSRFEDISYLLQGIIKGSGLPVSRLGICIDTAHVFASGYDLRDKKAVAAMVKKFDATVGLKYLRFLHLNDSKVDVGKLVDRHEHIGKGYIGAKGLAALFNHPRLSKYDFILETPEEGRAKDVTVVKKLRK